MVNMDASRVHVVNARRGLRLSSRAGDEKEDKYMLLFWSKGKLTSLSDGGT